MANVTISVKCLHRPTELELRKALEAFILKGEKEGFMPTQAVAMYRKDDLTTKVVIADAKLIPNARRR